MAMKCCTKLEKAKESCPIVFQGHPSNFKVTRDKTSPTLTQTGRGACARTLWHALFRSPIDAIFTCLRIILGSDILMMDLWMCCEPLWYESRGCRLTFYVLFCTILSVRGRDWERGSKITLVDNPRLPRISRCDKHFNHCAKHVAVTGHPGCQSTWAAVIRGPLGWRWPITVTVRPAPGVNLQ